MVAGSADGIGTNALFRAPSNLAVDGATNLYVADTDNHTIRKMTPVGNNWMVSTLAGQAGNWGHANGPGPSALFHSPTDVALDAAGNLYVADANNETIRKITTNMVVSTLAAGPAAARMGRAQPRSFGPPLASRRITPAMPTWRIIITARSGGLRPMAP